MSCFQSTPPLRKFPINNPSHNSCSHIDCIPKKMIAVIVIKALSRLFVVGFMSSTFPLNPVRNILLLTPHSMSLLPTSFKVFNGHPLCLLPWSCNLQYAYHVLFWVFIFWLQDVICRNNIFNESSKDTQVWKWNHWISQTLVLFGCIFCLLDPHQWFSFFILFQSLLWNSE